MPLTSERLEIIRELVEDVEHWTLMYNHAVAAPPNKITQHRYWEVQENIDIATRALEEEAPAHMRQMLDHIDTLQADIDAAREIMTMFTSDSAGWVKRCGDEWYDCPYCDQPSRYATLSNHYFDCPVARAQAWLAANTPQDAP